jgi:alkanesulfonate monooxygenase SsuD/methylene tetrahydromethanopterin reductase-like flavin-dependent oxidoreductase (luciferase family)
MCRPVPIQPHLPILIGGHGPRKTLRTVARHADLWNTSGYVDEVAARVRILEEHCADIGRDPSTIERTISFPVVIRDEASEATAAWDRLIRANGADNAGTVPHLLGSPDLVADAIRPYLELGFSTVIVRMPAPFDDETVERMPEVAARLGAVAA